MRLGESLLEGAQLLVGERRPAASLLPMSAITRLQDDVCKKIPVCKITCNLRTASTWGSGVVPCNGFMDRVFYPFCMGLV